MNESVHISEAIVRFFQVIKDQQLNPPVPVFEFPFESPIEEEFGVALRKLIDPQTKLRNQVEVETLCGKFRIDFLVTDKNGLRIAFECDGAEFHDAHRDEWRDSMIFGDNRADKIIRIKGKDIYYRIKGKDIYYRINDVLCVVAKLTPSIFSPDGLQRAMQMGSDEAKSCFIFGSLATFQDEDWYFSIGYDSRLIPAGEQAFWKVYYQYAKSLNGRHSLDSVMEIWRRNVIEAKFTSPR